MLLQGVLSAKRELVASWTLVVLALGTAWFTVGFLVQAPQMGPVDAETAYAASGTTVKVPEQFREAFLNVSGHGLGTIGGVGVDRVLPPAVVRSIAGIFIPAVAVVVWLVFVVQGLVVGPKKESSEVDGGVEGVRRWIRGLARKLTSLRVYMRESECWEEKIVSVGTRMREDGDVGEEEAVLQLAKLAIAVTSLELLVLGVSVAFRLVLWFPSGLLLVLVPLVLRVTLGNGGRWWSSWLMYGLVVVMFPLVFLAGCVSSVLSAIMAVLRERPWEILSVATGGSSGGGGEAQTVEEVGRVVSGGGGEGVENQALLGWAERMGLRFVRRAPQVKESESVLAWQRLKSYLSILGVVLLPFLMGVTLGLPVTMFRLQWSVLAIVKATVFSWHGVVWSLLVGYGATFGLRRIVDSIDPRSTLPGAETKSKAAGPRTNKSPGTFAVVRDAVPELLRLVLLCVGAVALCVVSASLSMAMAQVQSRRFVGATPLSSVIVGGDDLDLAALWETFGPIVRWILVGPVDKVSVPAAACVAQNHLFYWACAGVNSWNGGPLWSWLIVTAVGMWSYLQIENLTKQWRALTDTVLWDLEAHVPAVELVGWAGEGMEVVTGDRTLTYAWELLQRLNDSGDREVIRRVLAFLVMNRPPDDGEWDEIVALKDKIQLRISSVHEALESAINLALATGVVGMEEEKPDQWNAALAMYVVDQFLDNKATASLYSLSSEDLPSTLALAVGSVAVWKLTQVLHGTVTGELRVRCKVTDTARPDATLGMQGTTMSVTALFPRHVTIDEFRVSAADTSRLLGIRGDGPQQAVDRLVEDATESDYGSLFLKAALDDRVEISDGFATATLRVSMDPKVLYCAMRQTEKALGVTAALRSVLDKLPFQRDHFPVLAVDEISDSRNTILGLALHLGWGGAPVTLVRGVLASITRTALSAASLRELSRRILVPGGPASHLIESLSDYASSLESDVASAASIARTVAPPDAGAINRRDMVGEHARKTSSEVGLVLTSLSSALSDSRRLLASLRDRIRSSIAEPDSEAAKYVTADLTRLTNAFLRVHSVRRRAKALIEPEVTRPVELILKDAAERYARSVGRTLSAVDAVRVFRYQHAEKDDEESESVDRSKDSRLRGMVDQMYDAERQLRNAESQLKAVANTAELCVDARAVAAEVWAVSRASTTQIAQAGLAALALPFVHAVVQIARARVTNQQVRLPRVLTDLVTTPSRTNTSSWTGLIFAASSVLLAADAVLPRPLPILWASSSRNTNSRSRAGLEVAHAADEVLDEVVARVLNLTDEDARSIVSGDSENDALFVELVREKKVTVLLDKRNLERAQSKLTTHLQKAYGLEFPEHSAATDGFGRGVLDQTMGGQHTLPFVWHRILSRAQRPLADLLEHVLMDDLGEERVSSVRTADEEEEDTIQKLQVARSSSDSELVAALKAKLSELGGNAEGVIPLQDLYLKNRKIDEAMQNLLRPGDDEETRVDEAFRVLERASGKPLAEAAPISRATDGPEVSLESRRLDALQRLNILWGEQVTSKAYLCVDYKKMALWRWRSIRLEQIDRDRQALTAFLSVIPEYPSDATKTIKQKNTSEIGKLDKDGKREYFTEYHTAQEMFNAELSALKNIVSITLTRLWEKRGGVPSRSSRNRIAELREVALQLCRVVAYGVRGTDLPGTISPAINQKTTTLFADPVIVRALTVLLWPEIEKMTSVHSPAISPSTSFANWAQHVLWPAYQRLAQQEARQHAILNSAKLSSKSVSIAELANARLSDDLSSIPDTAAVDEWKSIIPSGAEMDDVIDRILHGEWFSSFRDESATLPRHVTAILGNLPSAVPVPNPEDAVDSVHQALAEVTPSRISRFIFPPFAGPEATAPTIAARGPLLFNPRPTTSSSLVAFAARLQNPDAPDASEQAHRAIQDAINAKIEQSLQQEVPGNDDSGAIDLNDRRKALISAFGGKAPNNNSAHTIEAPPTTSKPPPTTSTVTHRRQQTTTAAPSPERPPRNPIIAATDGGKSFQQLLMESRSKILKDKSKDE